MKVSKRIHNVTVLAMILFVGSTLSDDRKVCPRELQEGATSMQSMLNAEAETCSRAQRSLRQKLVSVAITPEEIRAAFKRVCDQRPTYTACLAAVKADTELCLEGMDRTMDSLSLGLSQTRFDVECEQDGARMAVIEQETRNYYSTRSNPNQLDIIMKCTLTAHREVGGRTDYSFEANNIRTDYSFVANYIMILEYRILVAGIECLEKHRRGEQDTLVNAGVAQWANMRDRMMCWDVQDKKEVLCKTIIDVV